MHSTNETLEHRMMDAVAALVGLTKQPDPDGGRPGVPPPYVDPHGPHPGRNLRDTSPDGGPGSPPDSPDDGSNPSPPDSGGQPARTTGEHLASATYEQLARLVSGTAPATPVGPNADGFRSHAQRLNEIRDLLARDNRMYRDRDDGGLARLSDAERQQALRAIEALMRTGDPHSQQPGPDPDGNTGPGTP